LLRPTSRTRTNVVERLVLRAEFLWREMRANPRWHLDRSIAERRPEEFFEEDF